MSSKFASLIFVVSLLVSPYFSYALDSDPIIIPLSKLPIAVAADFKAEARVEQNGSAAPGDDFEGVHMRRVLGPALSGAIVMEIDKPGSSAFKIIKIVEAIRNTLTLMHEDGTFDYQTLDGNPAKIGSLASANAWFLGHVIPALRALQEHLDDLPQVRILNPAIDQDIENFKPSLIKMADYVVWSLSQVTDEGVVYLWNHDHEAANRIFVDVLSIVASARFLKQNYLKQPAVKEFMARAAKLQNRNGCFPEAGPSSTLDPKTREDFSYHVVSMKHLIWRHAMKRDPAVKKMINNGIIWMLGRITKDGKINVTNNSRTAIGELNGYGIEKMGHDAKSILYVMRTASLLFPRKNAVIREKMKNFLALAYANGVPQSQLAYLCSDRVAPTGTTASLIPRCS